MAKSETTTARSPRGAGPVSQAFFTALATIPEASRIAVAKAAQAMIRDQMKMQRDKAKAAAVKEKAAAAKEKTLTAKAAKPVAAKPAARTKVASEPKVAPEKRRSRKPDDAPVAA